MGRLLVIEGVDGSGKATQSARLEKRLISEGINPVTLTFPDYDSDSSVIVKKYLAGEFGKNANDITPKIASTFFAVDRYASFISKWEKLYNDGFMVVADRYVTANMIHQASKFEKKEDKEKFIDWLSDFEYGLYGLPKPSVKIFLDVPPKISAALMKERLNKFSGEAEKDIHERDKDYLEKTYENARFVAENYGFKIVLCVKDGKLRSIEDIQEEIRQIADGI